MANWLERAKRENPLGPGRATAKTDERSPTAVMAVREPDEPEVSRGSIGSNGSVPAAAFEETETPVPLTDSQEREVRVWLSHIEETDAVIIAHVLNQCRTDADARLYFLRPAGEVPRTHDLHDNRQPADDLAFRPR